jgi:hypothetical protein
MAEVIRENINATPTDVYRHALERRLDQIKLKKWQDLTPEERDVVQEWLAFRSGLVSPG